MYATALTGATAFVPQPVTQTYSLAMYVNVSYLDTLRPEAVRNRDELASRLSFVSHLPRALRVQVCRVCTLYL